MIFFLLLLLFFNLLLSIKKTKQTHVIRIGKLSQIFKLKNGNTTVVMLPCHIPHSILSWNNSVLRGQQTMRTADVNRISKCWFQIEVSGFHIYIIIIVLHEVAGFILKK